MRSSSMWPPMRRRSAARVVAVPMWFVAVLGNVSSWRINGSWTRLTVGDWDSRYVACGIGCEMPRRPTSEFAPADRYELASVWGSPVQSTSSTHFGLDAANYLRGISPARIRVERWNRQREAGRRSPLRSFTPTHRSQSPKVRWSIAPPRPNGIVRSLRLVQLPARRISGNCSRSILPTRVNSTASVAC